jgi:hypothetical protein
MLPEECLHLANKMPVIEATTNRLRVSHDHRSG